MVETIGAFLTPGTYRLAELEQLLGRTRKTIERYIERFCLEKTEVDYAGRKVAAVILKQDSIDRIRGEIGESLESIDIKPIMSKEIPGSLYTLFEHEKSSLLEQLKAANEEVLRLSVENAKLTAKAESHEQSLFLKDEAIGAKDETIHSLKTSMMVLERANQKLEAEKRLPENKQQLAVNFLPVSGKQPKNLLERLKQVFFNF